MTTASKPLSYNHERDEMVKTHNGDTYSACELRAAFSIVEDCENWKNPINAWVNASMWPVVREAIIHFTGSIPAVCEIAMPDGYKVPLSGSARQDITSFSFPARIRIEAIGYYLAIGA